MRQAGGVGWGFWQIGLVDDQNGGDAGSGRGDQAAIDKFRARRGDSGGDDDGLIDIGGDQFAAHLIGAVQEVAAWCDPLDDAFARADNGELNRIVAGDAALFAANDAGVFFAGVCLDAKAFAVGRDDQALHYRANKASILAAQMKSDSDRPPMAWVMYSTRQVFQPTVRSG